MAWASGQSLASNSLTTSVVQAFVFGTNGTNTGTNLVNSTASSVTLYGSAAYGSDSNGVCVQTKTTGSDRLEIDQSSQSYAITSGEGESYMIVFSRNGTPGAWGRLCELYADDGTSILKMHVNGAGPGLNVQVWGQDCDVSAYSVTTVTSAAEQAVVVTRSGNAVKVYFTGGSEQSFTKSISDASKTLGKLYVGNSAGSGEMYPAHSHAWVRWKNRVLSSSDAQSLADSPQQVIAVSAPSAPSGVTASSVTASQASISWTDNSSNETGFKVRYATSPYSSWTTATGSVAASPYLVTGLTDGTSYKAGVAAFNGGGDSTWVESGVFTTTTLSKLRPNADTSTGSWSASSGSVLYSMIDEANADDGDYISANSATTCKLKFETSTDPADNSNHSIRIRARSTSGSLTVKLVQGDPAETTLVSWAPTLTSSFANYQYDLSTAEASVITDYSALYLKLTSS